MICFLIAAVLFVGAAIVEAIIRSKSVAVEPPRATERIDPT
jgi:hypothetical protein